MIQYSKGRVARQAWVGLPEGLHEELHGRSGFIGNASHLYHLHPPNQWNRIEGLLKPHRLQSYLLEAEDLSDRRGFPVRVFHNEDVVISLSRRSAPMPFCFRNGDGDELHFIHKGKGLVRTDYGPLRYEEGDYLLFPKGTSYQIIPDGLDNCSLIIETRGEIGFPERGNIGHYAPFDYGVIETPEPEPVPDEGHEWELRIKLREKLTSVFYDFCPFDVVGWKGSLSVSKLNIRDIRPLISDGISLPPTANCTFQAPGVLIGTVVPHPLTGDPKAERVQSHHRNVDYDEFYFIHAGSAGLSGNPATVPPLGMMAMFSQGLQHGPRKGEKEFAWANWRKDARNELSIVTVDCAKSLELSPQAEEAERRDAQS
jgi:homogentisate 1,2-dioxygenase